MNTDGLPIFLFAGLTAYLEKKNLLVAEEFKTFMEDFLSAAGLDDNARALFINLINTMPGLTGSKH